MNKRLKNIKKTVLKYFVLKVTKTPKGRRKLDSYNNIDYP